MTIVQESLFDNFTLDIDNTSRVLGKIKSPKRVKELSPEEKLKSDDVPFDEKLRIVTENVNSILGKFKEDTICIYDINEFNEYIDTAVANGLIAVDTETIGTRDDIDKAATDPYTCKIAGLCLYTPGKKNAYIPINHEDFYTHEKVANQITEEQVCEALKKLKDTKCIFHNSKFDYKVIYYTCGIKLPIYWDTMIGAQILNENEPAGLKYQYRNKIDPDQEKYSIEKLFNVEMFRFYPPELFALYAATDSYETYKLYLYQKEQFEQSGNEKLYNLFFNIEMPDVLNIAEMEMWGMSIDKEFAGRLSRKYHAKLDEVNKKIDVEMGKYADQIWLWRQTPEANYSGTIVEKDPYHTLPDKKKKSKSLSEKLEDPIDLNSSAQLGILLYDVLRVLKVGKDGKKVVDEATLLSINNVPLIPLILKKREYEKYLGTYIDVLPGLCSPLDGRLHAKINQLGREEKNVVTGRMSSSDPNLQNIPSRGNIVTVRCMFVPTVKYNEIESETNTFEVPVEEEVLMADGTYKWSSNVVVGDLLDGDMKVDSVYTHDRIMYITCQYLCIGL